MQTPAMPRLSQSLLGLLLSGLLLAACAVPIWIAQVNCATVISIVDRRSLIRDPAV